MLWVDSVRQLVLSGTPWNVEECYQWIHHDWRIDAYYYPKKQQPVSPLHDPERHSYHHCEKLKPKRGVQSIDYREERVKMLAFLEAERSIRDVQDIVD